MEVVFPLRFSLSSLGHVDNHKTKPPPQQPATKTNQLINKTLVSPSGTDTQPFRHPRGALPSSMPHTQTQLSEGLADDLVDKQFSHKGEDWSLGLQNPHKSWAGMVATCSSRTQKAEMGDS